MKLSELEKIKTEVLEELKDSFFYSCEAYKDAKKIIEPIRSRAELSEPLMTLYESGQSHLWNMIAYAWRRFTYATPIKVKQGEVIYTNQASTSGKLYKHTVKEIIEHRNGRKELLVSPLEGRATQEYIMSAWDGFYTEEEFGRIS